MASDAAKAFKVVVPPKKIRSCRDAWEVMVYETDAKRHEKAVNLVLRELRPEGPYMVTGRDRCRVDRRAETAFAAATLFLADEGALTVAMRAANWVTGQMEELGAWYSTTDSVAGLAMLTAMMRAGVIPADGDERAAVVLNGREMAMPEALAFRGQIDSITAPHAARHPLTVRAVRIREDDWDRFLSGAKVQAGLKSVDGQWVTTARPGDALELEITLTKGYFAGDLCHICLPPCLSFVWGGGQVKRMTIDFAGRDALTLPIAVTDRTDGPQHWAVCVRNMFDEDRGGNPGVQSITVGAQ